MKLDRLAVCILAAFAAPSALAGEPSWIPTFGGQPGTNGDVYAVTAFDDGSGGGPALYAGGQFATAGGVAANFIAKWDGASWSALGSGMNNLVRALTVFDDGSEGGPTLYAGGDFTTAGGVAANFVAKWDGTSWSALGSGMDGAVRALIVLDDGSSGGPALYAGGDFTTAGGVAADRVAKWDGSSWSALGSGVNNQVIALTVFDDGSGGGPALYAGGNFTTAGGGATNYIAKWDGSSWSALGGGMDSVVWALAVFDDGSGGRPALYAGGAFTSAGGVGVNYIGKWDGSSWSALGGGMDSVVWALAVFDDGSGGRPALYAGGAFTSAGGVGVNYIGKWDGTSWAALGGGMSNGVFALTVFDDASGGGPALYAGGSFVTTTGGVAVDFIARWDGASWSALGSGMDADVLAVTVFDDGSGGGPALYAGGAFSTAGGLVANRIAKWDGTSWCALGSGMDGNVDSLTVFDDASGGGPALYAGGAFTIAGGVAASSIAKWDGISWSALDSGIDDNVLALTVFDDGSGGGAALYAGGEFIDAGGVAANFIAKWDGNSWSALGSGMDFSVYALTVFDDGSGGGAALYAGGEFIDAGGVAASGIAKWDGTSWSALGSGMSDVFALTIFDDGSGGGPALYAGGQFTTAGGVAANNIAKWDGTTWSAIGSGLDAEVLALTVFDDGSGGGPALYVGGAFNDAGGVAADRIAKWDGTSWSALGSGVNQDVRALTVFNDGSGGGPALYAGGDFTTSPAGDSYIAKWGLIAASTIPFDPVVFLAAGAGNLNATGDLDGDGDVDVVIVIPDPDPKNPGAVQVFLNQGNDGMTGEWLGLVANTPVPVGRNPSGITVAQLDADIDLDIAVSNAGDDSVSLLFNDGAGMGTFDPVVTLALPELSIPNDVVAGDFDDDDDRDLATANNQAGGGVVVILVNNGVGGFVVGQSITLDGVPGVIEPEDIDNDKDLDIVAAIPGGHSVIIIQNGGSSGLAGLGPFLDPLPAVAVGTTPVDLAVGRLDGDLLPEIVTANNGDGTLSILRNLGGLSFAPAITLAVGDTPTSVDAADFDEDGDRDLAVTAVDEVLGPAVQVLRNETPPGGALAFTLPIAFAVDPDPESDAAPVFVVGADMDGDGVSDLITVNQGGSPSGGSVSVLISGSCIGDIDGNGEVAGFADLTTLLNDWGPCPAAPALCPSDLDGNGSVGFADLTILLNHWGPC